MNRRVGWIPLALGVVLALSAATPADADNRRRPTEVVKARRGRRAKKTAPITATGFTPARGAIGTIVTIRGSGFGRTTQVLFGGKRVRPRAFTRTTLQFAVPAHARTNTIVLRHPDMANDLVVGTFDIIVAPVIRSFAPATGVPGARVEIRGGGFRPGDQVLFHARPLVIEQLQPTRIVARIPDEAGAGFLIIARPDGTQAQSRRRFAIVQPAPVITGLSPARGPAGTTLRILGRGFTAHDQVRYGHRPLRVTTSSTTWLDVVIPTDARASQRITVRNEWGTATSREPFELERPPRITRLSPRFGVVGQRIEIIGANFMARDIVTLNGQPLEILQLRPQQISVVIPPGAVTGAFVIERGALRTRAPRPFEVVYPPSITGFSPAGGPPATRVTIAGSRFTDDARVFFGDQRARIVQRSATSITVMIPRRAGTAPFTVRTRGGEARSAAAFSIYRYSTITRVTPKAGPVGAPLRIDGRDFDDTDRFFLGDVELPIEQRSPRSVTVTIPPGARTARLSWESHRRHAETRWTVRVLAPLVVTSCAPLAGPPGTLITLTGERFTRQTSASWGDISLRIVRRELPTRIIVALPRAATGANTVSVVDNAGRAACPAPFAVLAPPTVEDFAPPRGTPGSEVVLYGAGFSSRTAVRLGRTAVPVVRWEPTRITVRLPDRMRPGARFWWVGQGRDARRSPRKFTVAPFASITRVGSLRASPGERVTVFGANFDARTRISWGDTACTVDRVARDGRSMQVVLPTGIDGRRYLWVDDHGHRARSPRRVAIRRAQPPRREKVRARRGRRRRHREGDR